MAEFILETSYPSRRIISQTENSSKSEDEFCSIICLDILSGKQETLQNIETSPSHVETSSKNRLRYV